MIVKVLLFASAKQLVGESHIELGLDDEATLGSAKASLIEHYPMLMNLLPKCTFSVDQEYAEDARPLYHGCEVACIPPVSGG